jgi:hypothetical protein
VPGGIERRDPATQKLLRNARINLDYLERKIKENQTLPTIDQPGGRKKARLKAQQISWSAKFCIF